MKSRSEPGPLTIHEAVIAGPAWCEEMGLAGVGHGLLLALDDDGNRWTLASLDLAYVRKLAKPEPEEREEDASLFPWSRRGWPGDW